MKQKLFTTICTLLLCSVSFAKGAVFLNAELRHELMTFIIKYDTVCTAKTYPIVLLEYKKSKKEKTCKIIASFLTADALQGRFTYRNPKIIYRYAGEINGRIIIVENCSQWNRVINGELTLARHINHPEIKKELETMNKLKGTKEYDLRYEGICMNRFVPTMSIVCVKKKITKVHYPNDKLVELLRKNGVTIVYE